MNETFRNDPFPGSGEMPALCRAMNWADTPLGPAEQWPAALRGAVRTCLESPFPMNLWCGDDLILIYNDAYRVVLGAKHPRALGRPGRDVWPEIWDRIEPMFARLRAEGLPVYEEDAPFVVQRRAGDERVCEPNAWFTFSLSPIRDSAGGIVAMLNIVSETTRRMLMERALRDASAKAERAEARLNEVFTQAPSFMAVVRGPDHVFEYVNSSYYQLIGHRELVGRPVLEALPEIRGQGFVELLDQVLETGVPYVGRENAVFITRTPGGEPEQRFLDFVYYPITEAGGTRTGVVAHGSDVTDHVLSRREAQRARREAEEASTAKSQFLANMSHEIRTPINAIMGYTDLLELGIAGPLTEGQRAQLERVRGSSRHLLAIVEDILDVAKVEAGRINVENERVLISSTVSAALTLVEPLAAERHVDLSAPCGADPETCYTGDEDRVRQILVNLLSNAVKFTEPGGSVTVTCGMQEERPAHLNVRPDGGITWVRVTDTGIGIPASDLETVFQPFTQVDSGRTRRTGGTGLGLTISRQLARLMGGDLTVESQVGAGSRFTLWLPSERQSLVELVDGAHEPPPPNLAAIGESLQKQAVGILERYRTRLRREPLMPQAAALGDADLEDHASTFVADIAQSLIALEKSMSVPDRLLQDGSEIQRVVAELHGRQRAQLRWSDEALEREWAVLWEEIEAAIRSDLSLTRDIAGGLDLLKRFLDRAERISNRARGNAVEVTGVGAQDG